MKIVINFIKKIFKKPTINFWIYGTCNDMPARKHIVNKNVQFILWKVGEQGYKEDYWHNFDKSHWNNFKKI